MDQTDQKSGSIGPPLFVQFIRMREETAGYRPISSEGQISFSSDPLSHLWIRARKGPTLAVCLFPSFAAQIGAQMSRSSLNRGLVELVWRKHITKIA